MTKRNKQFNAEFKQDAVNYYYSSGKLITEVQATTVQMRKKKLHERRKN